MKKFAGVCLTEVSHVTVPVWRNLNAFDPITATTVGPSFNFNLAVMYDNLFVKRRDDGAPASTSEDDFVTER